MRLPAPNALTRRLLESSAARAVVVTGCIALAYAPSWRFPFIQDDIGLFNWIGSQDLFGLWSASPFGYYRPLTQVVWKIGELIAGRFDPVMLHWVVLVAHAVNSLLVGYLAGRWSPDRTRQTAGWLATLLFALYPFTFQVVPFVGALYHPLVSMLILGTLAGYESFLARAGRGALAAALACAALAPFAHEAGMVAGPLLGLSELIAARMQRRRFSRLILVWAASTTLFGFIIWLSVPKLGPQTARPDFNGILINVSYALQGLIYPFGPLARSVIEVTGVSDQIVLWLGGGAFGIVAAWAAWRTRHLKVLTLGFLLWVTGALPFALTLAPRYVLAAAWLLYEQSTGAVLVWTAVLSGLAARVGSFGRLRIAAAAAGAISILIFGIGFVRTRLIYYDRLSEAVWSLGEVVRAHADDRSALVVNFPRLARPSERVFPIGVESPQFYARTASLRDVLAVNGLPSPEDVRSLAFGNLISPLDYSVEMVGEAADWPDLASAIASVARVYRGFPQARSISVRYAGRVMELAPTEPLVRFGGSVSLMAVESAWFEESVLALTLRWQYAGGADRAAVFVHVLSPAGQLVAQSDGLVMDMLPFWQWPAGRQVEEVRYIALPDRSAARVTAGVYDPGLDERLPPLGPGGQTFPDGVVPLLEIDPATGAIQSVLQP